jgi:hypothetical protein
VENMPFQKDQQHVVIAQQDFIVLALQQILYPAQQVIFA